MITERQLVENNVLYRQSTIIDEFVKANMINDDAIYEEDVLEWWLVTDHFARLLKAENEVILEYFGSTWWGRQCSGQAIYMDSVISDIAKTFNSTF